MAFATLTSKGRLPFHSRFARQQGSRPAIGFISRSWLTAPSFCVSRIAGIRDIAIKPPTRKRISVEQMNR